MYPWWGIGREEGRVRRGGLARTEATNQSRQNDRSPMRPHTHDQTLTPSGAARARTTARLPLLAAPLEEEEEPMAPPLWLGVASIVPPRGTPETAM